MNKVVWILCVVVCAWTANAYGAEGVGAATATCTFSVMD